MPQYHEQQEQGIIPGELTVVTVFSGEPAELTDDITFAEMLLGTDAAPEVDPSIRRFRWVAGYETRAGLGLRLERTTGLTQDSRLIARQSGASIDDIPAVSELMRKAVSHVRGKPTITGTNVARLFLSGTYLDVDNFLKGSIEGSPLARVVGGRGRDTQHVAVTAQFTVGGKQGAGQIRIERVEGRIAPLGRITGAGVEVNFNRPTTSKSAVYEALTVPLLRLQYAEAEKVFRRFAEVARRDSAR